MAVENNLNTSVRGPRRAALALAAAGAVTLLAGCVVAPVEPYEVGAPVVYSSAYGPAPVYGYGGYPYGYSAPYYGSPYGGPSYYGAPPVSLGFYGVWGDRGRDRGRDWRGPPPRGDGNRWSRPGGSRPPGAAGPGRPGHGARPTPPPGAGGGDRVRPPRASGVPGGFVGLTRNPGQVSRDTP
ncbi:MAG: hypothetical protein Q4G71_14770 [Pseudomonadota bacterium]|nr:hypothetical protein [Pseudomonadota bacterium]